MEFLQRRLQPILDRFGRDIQAGGDLAVGVPQADQRGHVLFTRRKRLPFLPESFVGGILSQASVQEFGDQFVFRTAFVFSDCGQADLQAVAQFQVIGTRVGRWTLAYQVQEAIPDRHTPGL